MQIYLPPPPSNIIKYVENAGKRAKKLKMCRIKIKLPDWKSIDSLMKVIGKERSLFRIQVLCDALV